VAAGHKVTVYSFEPIAGLPGGVGNAEAEASCRMRSPKNCATAAGRVMARLDILQFSDFFRMRLMARGTGLWLDADVLLFETGRDRSRKPFFAWGGPAPARQFGALSAGGRSDRDSVRIVDAAG